MRGDPAIGLAVERAAPGVLLVRVTGRLDRSGVAALDRLIGAQRICRRAGHVVVDLAGITEFDGAATELLGDLVGDSTAGTAGDTAGEVVRVHLAGCGGRAGQLPLRARRVLLRYRAYPSAEVAVRELAASPAPDTDLPGTTAELPDATAEGLGATAGLPAPRAGFPGSPGAEADVPGRATQLPGPRRPSGPVGRGPSTGSPSGRQCAAPGRPDRRRVSG